MKLVLAILLACFFYEANSFAGGGQHPGPVIRTANVKMSIVYDPYEDESSVWDFSKCPQNMSLPLHVYEVNDSKNFVTGWVDDSCEGTLNGMPVKFAYYISMVTMPSSEDVPFDYKRVSTALYIQVNNTPRTFDGIGYDPRSSSLVQVTNSTNRLDFPHQIFVNRWPHELSGRMAYQFRIHVTVIDQE